jgi:hypothetical protein
MGLRHLRRAIGRGVVDHDDLAPRRDIRLGSQGIQAATKHLSAVVNWDNDRERHACTHRLRKSHGLRLLHQCVEEVCLRPFPMLEQAFILIGELHRPPGDGKKHERSLLVVLRLQQRR